MRSILLTTLALLTTLSAFGQSETTKSTTFDTLSYCQSSAYCYNTVGSNDGTTWGTMFPASALSGQHYLHGVRLYVSHSGTYSLMLYQGGTEAPQVLTDSLSYQLTASGAWVDCPLAHIRPLDTTRSLWVVFHNTDVAAPAAYCVFTGDSNSSLIRSQGQWSYLKRVMPDIDPYPTWMIAAVTGSNLLVNIDGPTHLSTATAATFTVNGPAEAIYNWTLEGAEPATGEGDSVTASWSQTGHYTVSVTAIWEGDTATAQTTVEVFDCSSPYELPFVCGFEPTDNFDCWSFIDADGDGNNWDLQRWSGNRAHSGEGVSGSASYGNNIFNPVLHPDNWMITPELHIPPSGANLSWWAGSADARHFAEYYSVTVSTTGAEPDQFTHTLYADTLRSADYQQMEVSLASFAGQDIRIAFRHHDCSNEYWLLIDDIEVTPVTGLDKCSAAECHLYPNPTTGQVYIDGLDIKEICVTDACGRQLFRTEATHALDLRPYCNGVYFVRVTTATGTTVKKIVKRN